MNVPSAQKMSHLAVRDLDARKAVCAALVLATVLVAVRIAMVVVAG